MQNINAEQFKRVYIQNKIITFSVHPNIHMKIKLYFAHIFIQIYATQSDIFVERWVIDKFEALGRRSQFYTQHISYFGWSTPIFRHLS